MRGTITFRLDENVIAILRTESKTRHISLNALVNQTLQNFVEWNMYEPKVGMMSLFRSVVAEIFKKLTEQQIMEVAATIGREAYTDATLFMKRKIDLDSFLSWLEIRMRTSSIEISHNREGSTHRYVLKHNLGMNFSLFQKTLLELIFGEVLGIHLDCDYSDKILSFRFST
ncbi:MAG: hypothetical protein WA364_11800 [Candidatus Nitrosopolaris sp.]